MQYKQSKKILINNGTKNDQTTQREVEEEKLIMVGIDND